MSELIEYLPEVLQGLYEFRALCSAGDMELEILRERLVEAVDDNFVHTLTESGCARWESMLGIKPKATDSHADRRFRILAAINQDSPYTFCGLRRQLETLCGVEGYSAELDSNNYRLSVKLALTAKGQFDEADRLLRRIVPANIVTELSLKYNQHETLSALTHGQAAAYTHSDLRNEVLT